MPDNMMTINQMYRMLNVWTHRIRHSDRFIERYSGAQRALLAYLSLDLLMEDDGFVLLIADGRGEHALAPETAVELVRQKPDLGGVYRLLGLRLSNLDPAWKSDADMMRGVIGRTLQKNVMYRCRHCHFKSQVFFWHCPACNKWETFTPGRIEI